MTPPLRPPYTRATRATRRRNGSSRLAQRAGCEGPGAASSLTSDAIRRGAQHDKVAASRSPSGACAQPAARHRRAHGRGRHPVPAPPARRCPGGIGRAQPPVQAPGHSPAAARRSHRRHRPPRCRSARASGQPQPVAAHPARRSRRCPPSWRRRGDRVRRGLRRAQARPSTTAPSPRPMRRAGTVVLAQQLMQENVPPRGGDPRASPDPFHLERLAPPVAPAGGGRRGARAIPASQGPGAGQPVLDLQGGRRERAEPPRRGVPRLRARGARAARLAAEDRGGPAPRGGAVARPRAAPSGTEHVVRALRETLEQDPETRVRLADALARTSTPRMDARVRRLLERLTRLYAGPDSPYLDFYGPPRTIPTIPYDRALALLAGTCGSLDVRGKAVFIGLSAYSGAEQRDGVNTVFSEPNGLDLSGVEVAATAFANLAEARSVEPLSIEGELLLAIGWGLALGLPRVASAGACLGDCCCRSPECSISSSRETGSQRPGCGCRWSVRSWSRSGRPWPRPRCGSIVTRAASASICRPRSPTTSRRRSPRSWRARSATSAPRTSSSSARACRRTLTSTPTLSETMEPAELGALMNRYYGVLFEPVKRHGGLVQDVVGDSMLAVWATTEPDARCGAARVWRRSTSPRPWTASTRRRAGFALPTRIGLHSGRLLLGSVGAMDHYEYRAVGDIVNTATRLEGLNKHLGTRLLVSAEVLHGLEGLMTRELGSFLLAGKSRPIVVHELLGQGRRRYRIGPGALCYLCRGSRRLPAWSLARGSAALGRIAPLVRRRGWAKPLLPPMVRGARRRSRRPPTGTGSCAWTRSSQRAA